MGKRVITYSLGEEDKAIAELRAYKQEFLKKEQRLLDGLAQIGIREASVRFTTAMYDGVNDVTVNLNQSGNGFVIEASGTAVAFIEFGAGVYHNPSEPYPNPRPAGVVGIGAYGKGYGKRKAWGYRDDKGNLTITRGNPAAMPMWYASEEIRNSILRIAREVFI